MPVTSDDRTSWTGFVRSGPAPGAWPAGGTDATAAPLDEDGLLSDGAGEVPSDMVADALRWWDLGEERSEVGECRPVMLGGG